MFNKKLSYCPFPPGKNIQPPSCLRSTVLRKERLSSQGRQPNTRHSAPENGLQRLVLNVNNSQKCLCGNLCGPSTAHIDACAYKMPSCWIVDERSAWKPPHGRKARRGGVSPHHVPPFSRGVIFTRACVSLAPLSKNGGYSSSMFGTRDEARSPSFWPSTSYVSYSSLPDGYDMSLITKLCCWYHSSSK